MLVPFVEIALWLESAAACGSPRISELQGLATQLLARWDATAASGSFAEVIVHGDLNRDNVVITVDGPVLLDLECAGYGPVAWDLVAQWVAVRRYGRARSEYDRFCAVYGDDVRASPRFDLLLQVYELSLTAWALAQSEQSPQMRSESAVRVRGLLDSARGEWSLL
ncbi:MAG: aminoglycoside phosphotransferase (APT) family kinase protein [Bradymonadia bacterium]|jgi:aminoglycoside phosphotransferase (APT) family kinase protein